MSRAVSVSLIVGRPSRLRKPPGNLPGRRHPLAIIAGEREEVDSLPGGPVTVGRQDDRFTILDQATARRLFCQFSGFDGKNSGSDPAFLHVLSMDCPYLDLRRKTSAAVDSRTAVTTMESTRAYLRISSRRMMSR